MKGRKITILLSIAVLAIMVTPVFANGNGFQSNLYAGRKLIDVGDLDIYRSGDTLYITYITNPGCYLLETHLEVVTDEALFPLNKKGNPKIGAFTYSTDPHDPMTNIAEYEVPVSGEGPFYIAAHAVVSCGCKVRTAWGDTDGVNMNPFPGNSWAFYLVFPPP